MSVPLPSEHLSSPLILKNVFSAPQSSAIGRSPVGRASLAPLTVEGYYEHAAPFRTSKFPLI